jgi:hypothetical protein|tara:strand:- start:1111 stop:1833 length:723 start_codon:yes stop_codon:yes gene_type:complete
MKTYKSDFKILNEYQASSRKSFPLGTDYSFNYAHDKGIMLYIYDQNLDTSISFKAFLKSFSLSTVIKLDKSGETSGKEVDVGGLGITYSVSLDIPSLSVDDAMVNAARLEELDRMCGVGSEIFSSSGKSVRFNIAAPKYVLLANLIHNGLYREKHAIQYSSQVKTYGAKCFFTSNGWSVDTTMGFFEYNNKLWPKAYEAKLELSVRASLDNGKNILRGFDENESDQYAVTDLRTWPFGVY